MKKYILPALFLLAALTSILIDPMGFRGAFILHGRALLLLRGLGCTLFITVVSALSGLVLAAELCRMRLSQNLFLRMTGTAWVKFFEGLPTPALLLLAYNLLFSAGGADALLAAVIGFSLYFGAVEGEILRRAVLNVSAAEKQAALSLGFSRRQVFQHVIFPQILPTLIRETGAALEELIQETAVAGCISVTDLTRAADIVRGSSCETFLPLLLLLFVYWCIARLIAAGCRYAAEKTSPANRRDAAKKGVSL